MENKENKDNEQPFKYSGFELLPTVTRVEIIDHSGRAYVNTNAKTVQISFQDKNGTLKIFIT